MDSLVLCSYECYFNSHLCPSDFRISRSALILQYMISPTKKQSLDVVTNPLCVDFVYICKDQSTIIQKRDDPFTDATSSDWITMAHPMSALSWWIVTIFELLLFILVARKAKYHFWCKRRSKEVLKAHDIMEVMAKDSTDYFIM